MYFGSRTRRSIAAIRQLGGGILSRRSRWLPCLETADCVLLDGTGVADGDLQCLYDLQGLSGIKLRSTRVVGEFVGHLQSKSTITFLDLGESRFSDMYAADLASLPWLQILFLDQTPISAAGLRHLAALKLHTLALDGVGLTKDEILSLAPLRNGVSHLRLNGDSVSLEDQWTIESVFSGGIVSWHYSAKDGA